MDLRRLELIAKIQEECEETDSCDEVDPDEIGLLLYTEWPKYIEGVIHPFYIIGPNGTAVDGGDFNAVNWRTSIAATRSLLLLVFSEFVLATHTLYGARHGQLQLDPLKTDDIVHCVLVMCRGGSEHIIRAAMAALCGYFAKQYERHKGLFT